MSEKPISPLRQRSLMSRAPPVHRRRAEEGFQGLLIGRRHGKKAARRDGQRIVVQDLASPERVRIEFAPRVQPKLVAPRVGKRCWTTIRLGPLDANDITIDGTSNSSTGQAPSTAGS
jgi:hypothetical protein